MKDSSQTNSRGGLHLEGEEECPDSGTSDEGTAFGARTAALCARSRISEGALWANGTLTQPVEMRVRLCLEKFPSRIEVPAFRRPHRTAAGRSSRSHAFDARGYSAESAGLSALRSRRRPRMQGDHPPPAEAESKRKPDWSALDKLRA